MLSIETLWWVLFLVVGGALAVDLLVVHRSAKVLPFRQAVAWCVVWVSLALGFGALVAASLGPTIGGHYLAGYLMELSLSVDNVFVFAAIFTAFAVPAAYQHRLLFWGILGAVVFRGIFIVGGAALLDAAHWLIYALGILLIVTGYRMARSSGHAVDPSRNPVLRAMRRIVPMTDDYRGAAFTVREHGRRLATPLLAALVVIETTDVMFAIDSIPAVFSITTDPLIVFSSNLFAIVGLRSLYFLLAGLLGRFVYLKLGLAALLVFAGVKILLGSVVDLPIAVTLGVIVTILAVSIIASLLASRGAEEQPRQASPRWARPLVRVGVGVGVLVTVAALAMLAFIGAAAAAGAVGT